MRVAFLALIVLVGCAHGRRLQQQFVEEDPALLAELGLPQEPVFSIGSSKLGDVMITGMLQNFALNQDPIGSLLDRPSTSFLDLSWGSWVDQRLELLDVFQELMAPSRPRCPHMQAASVMDSGMVSYLASSRFGPAILTTYAQQAEEPQSEFDYNTVNLPAGQAMQRSYEDATLQEEMSADADRAFEIAELESRMLSQEPILGYFGANVKPQVLLNQVEDAVTRGEPIILTRSNMANILEAQQLETDASKQGADKEEDQPVNPRDLAIFVLLLVGCCYVWTSLIASCLKLRQQGCKHGSTKPTDTYLIVPLAPESADGLEKVQFASDYLPAGTYAKPLST